MKISVSRSSHADGLFDNAILSNLNFNDKEPVNFRQNDDGVTRIDVFSSTWLKLRLKLWTTLTEPKRLKFSNFSRHIAADYTKTENFN